MDLNPETRRFRQAGRRGINHHLRGRRRDKNSQPAKPDAPADEKRMENFDHMGIGSLVNGLPGKFPGSQ